MDVPWNKMKYNSDFGGSDGHWVLVRSRDGFCVAHSPRDRGLLIIFSFCFSIHERRLIAHLKKKTEKVSQRHMTLIWCLSPLVGFFLTPIMGRYMHLPHPDNAPDSTLESAPNYLSTTFCTCRNPVSVFLTVATQHWEGDDPSSSCFR